jgi:putative toxin-antitoxin system antitoxin component (TIGR02293 family)
MSASERLRYRIVLQAARRVFESETDARAWLDEPSIPLGNVTPRSLLCTEHGMNQVLYELGQMEYGQQV